MKPHETVLMDPTVQSKQTWPAPVLDWPIASLAHTLGFPVEAVGRVDSTNTELMRRVRAGCLCQPVLLAAEQQSAARGRLGRTWQTGMADSPGSALAFSLALPLRAKDWSGLSLAVGLAAAESLHPAIRLKWPNDLWLWDGHQGSLCTNLRERAHLDSGCDARRKAQRYPVVSRAFATKQTARSQDAPATMDSYRGSQGRKLGGILIETAVPSGGCGAPERIAVIGIGINIAPLAGDGFSTPPASLSELGPGLDAPGALALLAPAVTAAVRAFEHEGFAPLLARYAARDLLAGQWVRCSNGVQGQSLGVGLDGALRLRLSDGVLRQITSGEVSVRPTEQVG